VDKPRDVHEALALIQEILEEEVHKRPILCRGEVRIHGHIVNDEHVGFIVEGGSGMDGRPLSVDKDELTRAVKEVMDEVHRRCSMWGGFTMEPTLVTRLEGEREVKPVLIGDEDLWES